MVVPYLIICARESPAFGPAAANSLWQMYTTLLISSIKEEPDQEVMTVLFMALRELLEGCDSSLYTQEMVQGMMELIVDRLKEHDEM